MAGERVDRRNRDRARLIAETHRKNVAAKAARIADKHLVIDEEPQR